jgi:hypothetical protein
MCERKKKRVYDYDNALFDSNYQNPYNINSKTIKTTDVDVIPKPTPPKPTSTMTDEEGLHKAYSAPDAIFVDGNKMYVAGTRSFGEAARDWWKIATWHTPNIERYGELTDAIKNHPEVDTLIGHSLGASAVAELQRQTNNKYLARYYGAPFLNLNPLAGPDPKNQTFRHPGDPISAFDHNADDVPSNTFNEWWWSHGYGGYDQDKLPKTYDHDFDPLKQNKKI